MSGLFGSITIKGNRLTDLVGQTSTVGKPIPFGYGICKITEPNVIWTAGIPKEHVKKKKQGKGGVKTEEYTYTLSYAIAVMAGPIYGYLTIKRGGKVVYTTDPSAPVEDQAFAAKWQQKVKFYLGTRTQMPDATIESYKGAGQVSAFRDLAYIVVEDDDVTSEGGAVPQYEFVCVADGVSYSTSKLYPVETEEGYESSAPPSRGQLYGIAPEEFEPSFNLIGGQLRQPVINYALPPEEFDAGLLGVQSGILKAVVVSYAAPFEAYDTSPPTVQSGVLKVTVIPYAAPFEAYDPSIALQSGTLS